MRQDVASRQVSSSSEIFFQMNIFGRSDVPDIQLKKLKPFEQTGGGLKLVGPYICTYVGTYGAGDM
jgi:uncharacterized membrane protein